MEKLLINPRTGEIVMCAIPSVGVGAEYKFDNLYGYPKNGFPQSKPKAIIEDPFILMAKNANK